jgi:hypothetical protein
LVPLLLFGAFRYGWAVSYHEITEKRANQIQHAIESFHIENGTYPEELRELVPNYLFWIPEPVILRGESWCYQGGRDFYQLGAYFREYFSTPLSLQIYASAGKFPVEIWDCEQRLPEMKARYDPPSFYGSKNNHTTDSP